VQDEISGEAVAVKLITRVFDKLQLAKRALREITLLRHFNDHDNVNFFSRDFESSFADYVI
jgi:hypothetical protein